MAEKKVRVPTTKALKPRARKEKVKVTRKVTKKDEKKGKTRRELARDIKKRKTAKKAAAEKKTYRMTRKYTGVVDGLLGRSLNKAMGNKQVLPKKRVYRPITLEEAKKAFEAFYRGKALLRRKMMDLKYKSPVVMDSRYLTKRGPAIYDFPGVDLGTRKHPNLRRRVYVTKAAKEQNKKLMESIIKKTATKKSRPANKSSSSSRRTSKKTSKK